MDSFDLMLILFAIFFISIIFISDRVNRKLDKINKKIGVLKSIIDFHSDYQRTKDSRKSKLEKHWRRSMFSSLNYIFGLVKFKEDTDKIPVVFEKKADNDLNDFDRNILAKEYQNKHDELENQFKSLD